jgi:predicted metal-dependent HD superfamily phosphohydrolase
MPQSAIKKEFIDVVTLISDELIAKNFWHQVESAYTDRKRHYHTLPHIIEMHSMLTEVKSEILEWDAIILAICWHDIIYNPLRNDNEERSVNFVEVWLKKLEVAEPLITSVCNHIIATKTHELNENNDTNYFLDADIAVLGKPEAEYQAYAAAIRKEFTMFPDMIYIPARTKVLRHFLDLPAIYKTPRFKNAYEEQARKNLEAEIKSLGG